MVILYRCFRGPVFFVVWETTCPACLGEMDDLEELHKEYDPSQFRLIGICADLYDTNGEIRPEQLETAKELMEFIRTSVVGFTTTFVVNSEGNLVNATAGAKDLKSWEEYVNAELDKLQ